MIDEELNTEDVENYLGSNEDKRIFVRMQTASSEDFSFVKIIGFLKTLEESIERDDIDVILYSNNSLIHSRALTDDKINSKAMVTEKLLNRLHLDYLPYTEVIISVPQNGKNEEIIRNACVKYGIMV